jgi:putative acetyltransferase
MAVSVRCERPGDEEAIRHVTELAFGRSAEADLVEALRGSDAWLPGFSLVADADSEIVGHVLFSTVRVDSGHELLSLAPMAVLPERQRTGVGAALVRAGLAQAHRSDYPLVVVLGHPEYYPRFGFEPADRYGIETPYEVAAEAWMALTMPTYTPAVRGRVQYPAAFAGL